MLAYQIELHILCTFTVALKKFLEEVVPFSDVVGSEPSGHHQRMAIGQGNEFRQEVVVPLLRGWAAVQGKSVASYVENWIRPLVRDLPVSSQVAMIHPKARQRIERAAERRRRELMWSGPVL